MVCLARPNNSLAQHLPRPAPPRATPDELAVLRDGDHLPASGFHCVFPHGGRYRARVRRNSLHLGLYPTPVEAASAVVAWYKRVYGPDRWQAVFKHRKVNFWRVCFVPRRGGYVADVWLEGRCQRVCFGHTVRKCRAADRDKDVWVSPEEARRAIRRFLYWQVGLLAPLVCYIASPVRRKKH